MSARSALIRQLTALEPNPGTHTRSKAEKQDLSCNNNKFCGKKKERNGKNIFRLKTRTPKNADKAKYAHAHAYTVYTNTNTNTNTNNADAACCSLLPLL